MPAIEQAKPRTPTGSGLFCVPPGVTALRITRADGLITTDQAAALAKVKPGTIRQWVARGKLPKAGLDEQGRSLFEPRAVALAEVATRERARRIILARTA